MTQHLITILIISAWGGTVYVRLFCTRRIHCYDTCGCPSGFKCLQNTCMHISLINFTSWWTNLIIRKWLYLIHKIFNMMEYFCFISNATRRRRNINNVCDNFSNRKQGNSNYQLRGGWPQIVQKAPNLKKWPVEGKWYLIRMMPWIIAENSIVRTFGIWCPSVM